jgi:phage/plasmid-like protein (TIGR03299 family)
MTAQTYNWLARNVYAGFADTRRPWWADSAEAEGNELNLFPGAVPMERVYELIASWEPVETTLSDVDLDKIVTLYDADMNPVQALRASDISILDSHKGIKASDDGSQLAVVGKDYAVHKYGDWLTGSISEVVGDDVQVSSAGLLRNRAQAWVQIERPETAVGPDGIKFSPYVVASTSLDYSLVSQVNQNTTMVVCDNTLEIGRGQGLAFRAKHTKNSGARLGDQRSVLAAIMAGESDFRAELERQLAIEVPDTAFSRFLESFVPILDDDIPAKKTRSERKRQEITHLYRDDARVAGWKGTEFGVVQAVNTWNTHMSQLRNATGYELSDTSLRAMRNYSQRLSPSKGASPDQETVKLLEAVLA